MVRDTAQRWIGRLGAALAIALALAFAVFVAPQPAHAQSPGIAPSCHAYSDTRLDRPGSWICSDAEWDARHERATLYFALGPNGKVPAYLTTRIARFGTMRVGVVTAGEPIRWQTVPSGRLVAHGHMRIGTPLALAGQPARAILVEFSRPTLAAVLSHARLVNDAPEDFSRLQLWLAALCGLLLAPLVFNLAFYWVLRERYLLWHTAVVGFMLTQTLVSSGLASLIVPLPAPILSALIAATFCGGTASALMLAETFIERDMLSARQRQALRICAVWIVVVGSIFLLSVDRFQQWAVSLYYLAWVPVLAVVCWTVGTALRRGSRAAQFQVAAWFPLLLSGAMRILDNMLGAAAEPTEFYLAQHMAVAFEVVMTTIGIIDRFMALRIDHDRHKHRASTLEQLAVRDPLTGLSNRRAIEPHFTRLRAEGFSTFAVIDLDHFKDINDRFGHAMGDMVLQAAARALTPDEGLHSMRLGGEEFVLLLRGNSAAERAEWCRQAIAARIAAEVEGLDRMVTASMGLVEIPEDVMPRASFAAIYARADGLLYQAKRGGRNRTVKERLTAFKGRSQAARRSA